MRPPWKRDRDMAGLYDIEELVAASGDTTMGAIRIATGLDPLSENPPRLRLASMDAMEGTSMERPVVVYHDNCHDGITALWCAVMRYPEAEPYAGRYDEPPDLERLRGRDVLIVDFSWKRQATLDVAEVAASVLILDHHKSSRNELAGLSHPRLQVVFDMDRSGAGITWDTLFPNVPRPIHIDYVEDRDLWRMVLPDSREVHAACASYPLTLQQRHELITSRSIPDLAREGTAILRYQRVLIAGAKQQALRMTIAGHSVPALRHPNIELRSELAGELAAGEPFAAVYFDRPDGKTEFSLRSRGDKGLDVSQIAETFGGGGHLRAAGFVWPSGEIDRLSGDPCWSKRWRTGRKLGRTLYVQKGETPGPDDVIGMMDTREYAKLVIDAVNAFNAPFNGE